MNYRGSCTKSKGNIAEGLPALVPVPVTATKCLRSQLEERKFLCWCIVSISSAHGCLFPCTWAEYVGIRIMWLRKLLPLMTDMKQRVRKATFHGTRPHDHLPPAKCHLQILLPHKMVTSRVPVPPLTRLRRIFYLPTMWYFE